jgi:GNAT superfamily N-acetyltransferase
VVEIRAIEDGELDRWVAVMRAVDEDTGTVEDYVDWRRQAQETVWFLASGDPDLGAGIGVGGWHEPPGVARGDVRVVRSHRGNGVGSALLERLGSWASGLGYGELIGEVRELDAEGIAAATSRSAETRASCSTSPRSKRLPWIRRKGSRSRRGPNAPT